MNNTIQTSENQPHTARTVKATYETPVLVVHGKAERMTLQTGTF